MVLFEETSRKTEQKGSVERDTSPPTLVLQTSADVFLPLLPCPTSRTTAYVSLSVSIHREGVCVCPQLRVCERRERGRARAPPGLRQKDGKVQDRKEDAFSRSLWRPTSEAF